MEENLGRASLTYAEVAPGAPCPTCLAPAIKEDPETCNAMTCACGTHFCFLCGEGFGAAQRNPHGEVQHGNLASFRHYHPDEEGVVDLSGVGGYGAVCPQVVTLSDRVPRAMRVALTEAWRRAARAWASRQLGPPATVLGRMNGSLLQLMKAR